MFYFSRSRRGNLAVMLSAALGVGALSVFMSQFFFLKNASVKKKLQDTRYTIAMSSGIETMVFAYRLAELKYLTDVSNADCSTARPFLDALAKGSDCVAAPSIAVFSGKCASQDDPECGAKGFFSYGAGCKITPSVVASCLNPSNPQTLVSIGAKGQESERFDAESFAFFLTNVSLSKGIAEFVAVTTSGATAKPIRHAFAIRSTLTNAAHIEVDGRITQEHPDPLDWCKGSPWATYFLFSGKKCLPFAELGGGTGLAFYKSRFFGFRPADGEIIDMKGATMATSYRVDPSGLLTGTSEQIFVPYDREMLVNVDDLTIIGDQLYFVAGSGSSAHIGYLQRRGNVFTREKICDLAALGWSQAYSGIAALSWSDPLDDDAGGSDPRMARFFLKTDSGDLLTAFVTNTTGTPASGNKCYVFKDANLQQIEYARTSGFDRTAQSKPYLLY